MRRSIDKALKAVQTVLGSWIDEGLDWGSTGLKAFIVPHRGHLISIVSDIARGAAFIKRRRQLAHRMDSTLYLK